MPTLARDKAWLEPAAEVTAPNGCRGVVTVTRYALVFPVSGQPPMFRIPTTRSAAGTILGELDRQASTLRLFCDNPRNAGQAKAHLERILDRIERRLDRTRADIQAHNQRMAKQIPAAVARRRAELRKEQNLKASIHASIGYPIMRRPDADSYSVPLKRNSSARMRRGPQVRGCRSLKHMR